MAWSTAKAKSRRGWCCGSLRQRLRECGLELHPEKTRIVYCQDINRPAAYPMVQFTFLGYTFRPRKAVDKYGRVYVNFAPAVSREAMTAMRQTVRGWHLQLKCDKSLSDLSNMFDPVLRGWANYYGRFHAIGDETALAARERLPGPVDAAQVQASRSRGHPRGAKRLAGSPNAHPRSFVHWELGFIPARSMMGAG